MSEYRRLPIRDKVGDISGLLVGYHDFTPLVSSKEV